jgi:catalase
MPESMHMLMWVMSDRGIPRSYRMMQGFGVHTFRFVNEAGAASLVKFHWKPLLGTHSHVWEEAVAISGCDPDYHRRDLWDAIEAGEYPEWELGVQIFTEEQADAWSFDVLDATKLVPEELVPVTPLGRMVLNRNPDNFFAETEQVAFCTAHVIPGIDFTNDPLLAGRIHSYVDTQLSRLGGPNFHELPINAPLVPVQNNQRDGMHRQAIPRGRVAYEPNSLGGGCPFQTGKLGFVPFPEPMEQDELRGKPERFAEHYQQAQLFWDSQTPVEQAHVIAAFRFELSKVTVPAIRERNVAMLRNVSDVLAGGVAAGLGMTLPEPLPKAMANPAEPEVQVSPALSLRALPGDGGIRTRKVAIVIADGVDGVAVETLRTALRIRGCHPASARAAHRALHHGGRHGARGRGLARERAGVLFDGLVLPGGSGDFAVLGSHAPLTEAIREQHRHGKTILALGSGVAVLSQAGLPADSHDVGLLEYVEAHDGAAAAFVEALGMHRHYEERVAARAE